MARKGLPAKYIRAAWKTKGATKKNALKRAWAAFRRAKGSSKSSLKKGKTTRKTKRKSNPKGGNRRMGKNTTARLFKLVRLGALAAPAISYAMGGGSGEDKVKSIMHAYTGYRDGKFDFHKLAIGWGPYLGAIVVTYGIPKLAGLIRRL